MVQRMVFHLVGGLSYLHWVIHTQDQKVPLWYGKHPTTTQRSSNRGSALIEVLVFVFPAFVLFTSL